MTKNTATQENLKPFLAVVAALFAFLILALPMTFKAVQSNMFGVFDQKIELHSDIDIEPFIPVEEVFEAQH